MSYSGLLYPKDSNYIKEIKERGYFILVDRNNENIVLVPGGNINKLISNNNDLLFIFDKNIAGTKQDIIDSLYLSGISIEEINNIISFGIDRVNLNTPISQQWINIFRNQNNKFSKPVILSETTNNRRLIYDEILKNYLKGDPNFETIPNILPILFNLYDTLFYHGKLKDIITRKNIHVMFDYGTRLTKISNKCTNKGCFYTIRISQPITLENFQNNNELQCNDRLECLLYIFEKELENFIIKNK